MLEREQELRRLAEEHERQQGEHQAWVSVQREQSGSRLDQKLRAELAMGGAAI